MLTGNENPIAQPIDHQNYAIHRTYYHENPWQKSLYPPPSLLFSSHDHFYRPTDYPLPSQFFPWNHLSSPIFYHPMTNYPVLLAPPPPPSKTPVRKAKRPRLTAGIRSEIVKIKSSKPTVFLWEIQQNLLQTGICTSHTLPHASTIQRVLKDSLKPPAKVTICLSPSPSPSDSQSECSICLESYRSGQEVSILACAHEYHSSCIAQWMMKNRSCPMCRKDIHNQPQFVTLLI